jgi:uncharacterized SAM-binding protein YcdF (DUF218 family)
MIALRITGLMALLVFGIVAFTPLVNRVNGWMAGTATLARSDAIVVLGRGGADSDGVLTNRSLRRVLRGIALYNDALAPILVMSGSTAETEARSNLARGLGVPGAAILTAGHALTTREEAQQLAKLLQPLGRCRILLVADPIDMPRTSRLMERAGFDVRPAPTASSGPSSPESRLSLAGDLAVELLALAHHRLVGAL